MRKIALLTILLALVIFINTSLAVEVTLFGPQTYERQNGKPFIETVNFSISGLSGTGQLIIHNGGSDKKTRVSSAEIWFNDNLIFGPSDFNKNVEHLVADVPLSDYNEISVKLNGKLGSYLIIKTIKEVDADAAAVVGPEGGVIEVVDTLSPIRGVAVGIPENSFASDSVVTIQFEENPPSPPACNAGLRK